MAPPPKRAAAAAQPGVTSKAAQPSEAPLESQPEAENSEILEMAAREISAAMRKVGSGGAPRTEGGRGARPDRPTQQNLHSTRSLTIRDFPKLRSDVSSLQIFHINSRSVLLPEALGIHTQAQNLIPRS